MAGALALLLQVAPQLSADDQAALLQRSAHDLGAPGTDSTFGAGSLDITAAARLLSPTLDFTPPELSNPISADGQVRIHALDGSSAIAGGELWVDADPGAGSGQLMQAGDGSFDSASEDLVGILPELEPGEHAIGFRARDAAGNWSAAALLPISVPGPPVSLPAISPPAAATPALTVAMLPLAKVSLTLVANDGFEHGLRAWSRRSGNVTALRAAAISGRRGLRVRTSGRARAFVARHLARAGARGKLAFAFRARTISTASAWTEIAAIDAGDGGSLAAVELRAGGRGPVCVRVVARGPGGALSHSGAQAITRRPVTIGLALDAEQVVLSIDGRRRASLKRASDRAAATEIALGLERATSPRATGYFDVDNVTVLSAPDQT